METYRMKTTGITYVVKKSKDSLMESKLSIG